MLCIALDINYSCICNEMSGLPDIPVVKFNSGCQK